MANGRGRGRAGDADQVARGAREQRGKGEHHHAAQRGAAPRCAARSMPRDSQGLVAAAGDVLDGEIREGEAIGRAGGRVDRKPGWWSRKQLPSEFTHTTK